jgi:hypothetical protein
MMAASNVSPESIERRRNAAPMTPGVITPGRIVPIIESGGFAPLVQFFPPD